MDGIPEKTYSFSEVNKILRISQEQFNALDKMDDKKGDGLITESIFKAALDMRIKKQGSENIKPEWQKPDAGTLATLHNILDNDYTNWDKPQKMQFQNMTIKIGSGKSPKLPDEEQKALNNYMKDLLRVYQTTGKIDKNAVTTMIPANMKIYVLNKNDVLCYNDAKNDKNDYDEQRGEDKIHHKVADGISIIIEYGWTDKNGKNYSGVGILKADAVQ